MGSRFQFHFAHSTERDSLGSLRLSDARVPGGRTAGRLDVPDLFDRHEIYPGRYAVTCSRMAKGAPAGALNPSCP
jgi:hypothetical protein